MDAILTVLGARPQFIKAATVSRAIQEASGLSETLVRTAVSISVVAAPSVWCAGARRLVNARNRYDCRPAPTPRNTNTS